MEGARLGSVLALHSLLRLNLGPTQKLNPNDVHVKKPNKIFGKEPGGSKQEDNLSPIK